MTLEPGRDLDAKVAEALGWIWVEHPDADLVYFRPPDMFRYGAVCRKDRGDLEYTNALPHYSTDIAAAWKVVEAMYEQGLVVLIKSDGLRRRDDEKRYTILVSQIDHRIDSDTAPHAICLAFLNAKGIPQ